MNGLLWRERLIDIIMGESSGLALGFVHTRKALAIILVYMWLARHTSHIDR